MNASVDSVDRAVIRGFDFTLDVDRGSASNAFGMPQELRENVNIRISYLRTPTEGFCVAESFDVSYLPRIGDNVFLPETLLDVFREHGELVTGPLGPAKRYRVVGVEHRWDDIAEKPHVTITRLDNLERWSA